MSELAAGMTDQHQPEGVSQRGYGRRRAVVLALVYVLFCVHIIHWQLAGSTLAPLEFNEVMHTLELGIITAGFLFMCLAAVGTLLFGRFFCSWGCHVLALQDLCSWLLRQAGIRQPRQIRSRVLLWVPIIAALYMFVWPQVTRLAAGRPMPVMHLTTDASGWASFVTQDFWRNLPGPWVTGLTFAVCGFLIVYLLGSRSFCTYCCPYGAVFALADKFAPGRIRASSDCTGCAECTAVCSSGIRVHEEIGRHAMIVNSACLKDLDCVAACPEQALQFGFGRPALFRSFGRAGRFGLPFDFSLGEDVFMASVFAAVLVIFRGLYGVVPFFLTLALGCMVAFVAVLTLRLKTRPHVRFAAWQLKIHGRVTRAGVLLQVFSIVLAAVVGHSAFIRFHEARGLELAAAEKDDESAYAHLAAAYRWGLFDNELVERNLLAIAVRQQRFATVERLSVALLDRHPDDVETRIAWAQALSAGQRWTEAEEQFVAALDTEGATSSQRALAHQGLGSARAVRRDFAGAIEELRAALALAPELAEAHAELGGMYAEVGRSAEALDQLREAVRLAPEMGQAQFNLGSLLLHLGRPEEAIPSLQQALAAAPSDGDTLNNLGLALLAVDRVEEARHSLESSLAVDPDNPEAHFNLARTLAIQGQMELAAEHLRSAARLDPRYEEVLRQLQ